VLMIDRAGGVHEYKTDRRGLHLGILWAVLCHFKQDGVKLERSGEGGRGPYPSIKNQVGFQEAFGMPVFPALALILQLGI